MADKIKDDAVFEILSAYNKAYDSITLKMMQARGDVSYATSAKQKILLAQIGIEIDAMTGAIENKLAKSLLTISNHETKTAIKDLALLGDGATKASEWHLEYNKGYVQQVFKDNFQHVAAQTDKMSADIKGELRRETALIMQRAAVEGLTRKQATKELHGQMISKEPGFKFVDKAGRTWDNQTYFEMLTRTLMHTAQRETYINTLTNEGHDLVIVSTHGAKDKCHNWEGKVISLTGATEDYPTLSSVLKTGDIFHPRCKHTLIAYHKKIQDLFDKVHAEGEDPEKLVAQHAAKIDAEKAKIAAAAIAAAPKETWDFKDFTQIGPQKGSNEGGLYQSNVTGEKFYIKIPKSTAHARNEVLAAELYKLAGIDVPQLTLMKWGDGRTAVASKWQEGLTKPLLTKLGVKKFHEGFAVDAWLANWDVAGLSFDNIAVTKDGKGFRLDVGGALLYRAQGSAKGNAFGDKVTEIATLRDAGINAQAAKVFGNISDTVLMKSMRIVEKIDKFDIKTAMENVGYNWKDDSAVNLYETLIARQKSIQDQRLALYYKFKGEKASLQGAMEDEGKQSGKGWWNQNPTEADLRLLREHNRYGTYSQSHYIGGLIKKGLTREEAMAIVAYTNGSYADLNRILRTEREQAGNRDWIGAYARICNSGLEKLAKAGNAHRGTVTRKIDLNGQDLTDFVKTWQPGATHTAYDFWSTSTGRKTWRGNVVLTIKSKTGVSIQEFSTHSTEKEVLMKAGTKYKVLNYNQTGAYHKFTLEEV